MGERTEQPPHSDGRGGNLQVLGENTGPAHRGVAWLLLALSILTVTLLALIYPPRDMSLAREGDDIYYRSMAFNLFETTRPDLNTVPGGLHYPHQGGVYYFEEANGLNHQPPFVWRVATPLLARVLSVPLGNIDRAFYAMTFLSLCGAMFFLALTLYVGLGKLLPALVAMGLFPAGYWLAGRYLFHYMYVDPLSIFLSCLAVYLLMKRNRGLFFVVCAAAVLNKESGLALLLAYPLSEWFLDRKVRASSVAAVVSIAAVWLLVQTGLRSMVPVDTYSPITLLRYGTLLGMAIGALLGAGVMLIPTWRGLASPIALSLIPVLIPPLVGSHQGAGDSPRYYAQLLPVLAVFMFAFWPSRWIERTLALVPAALFAFTPLLVHEWDMDWPLMKFSLAVVLCSEVVLAIRLRRRLRFGWRLQRPATTQIAAPDT
jgi:hypothetical protein